LSRFSPEGLRKATLNLKQYSRSPVQDLNPGALKCRRGLPTIQSSILSYLFLLTRSPSLELR